MIVLVAVIANLVYYTITGESIPHFVIGFVLCLTADIVLQV